MKDKRKQIDKIDKQIVELLGKRMSLVKEIGQHKKEASADVTDTEREYEIRERLEKMAKENGISEEFIVHLYTHIFIESRRIQGLGTKD